MGSVDIAFIAHNPGDWFLHCHKPMHMAGGMITLVKVG
jgi:FtsP/CotA-like multicopper oxidase with cupredoxin domain